jgi:hypothetical protein
MAGRNRDVSVAADVSHSLSVEYTVLVYLLVLKRLLTNQLNDTESSLAFTRQVLGHLESADFRGLKSTPEVCVKEFRDGVLANFILRLVWPCE